MLQDRCEKRRSCNSGLLRWMMVVAILVGATLACACAVDKTEGGIRGSTLVSETFPGEVYHAAALRSEKPGMLYFQSFRRYGPSTVESYYMDIKGYRASEDNELTPVAADFGRDRKDEVIAVLPNGFLRVGNCGGGPRRDLFFSTMTNQGGGAMCVFYAKGRSTRKNRLIGNTEHLPAYYSEETGAVLLDFDGYGGVRVKTNDADPAGDGVLLMEVKAFGRGFAGDEYVQAFVTGEGKVYRFDTATLRLAEDTALEWLSHVLEEPAVRDNTGDPLGFAFAQDVLAVESGDGHVLMSSSKGRTGRLEQRDVLSTTPDGKPRDEKELKRMEMDRIALRPEGYKVGTDFVSRNITVIPVDSERVAVYDRNYQRLVFISAK